MLTQPLRRVEWTTQRPTLLFVLVKQNHINSNYENFLRLHGLTQSPRFVLHKDVQYVAQQYLALLCTSFVSEGANECFSRKVDTI